MSFLPTLEEQVAAAADRHPIPVNDRGRMGSRRRILQLGVLAGIMATSGVAYASQGLWRPLMGDNGRGHPAVSAAPLPATLTDHFHVLARPQTDDDRGIASQDALRWQPGGRTIQTGGVRRLGTASDGTALVVIPLVGTNAASADSQSTSEVCLWRKDPTEAGRASCASTEQVTRSGLQLVSLETRSTPTEAADEARKAWFKSHPEGGRIPDGLGVASQSTVSVIGLVPDDVAFVRFGDSPGVRAAAKNNVFEATVPANELENVTWFDGRGQPVAR